MVFHYSFCLLKSNNSHRLLISCTCTTQTIRRTTRTRSSSFINNGHLDNSGFHPQHAGGELGRLAEHLPPHRPRRMLLTRLMWSTRKSKVSFFSHLVRCGNISPVCISGVQGSDGSIFHERPPEVRFDVRHEPPITRRLKFRSTPRRCTRLCTTNVYNRTVRAHLRHTKQNGSGVLESQNFPKQENQSCRVHDRGSNDFTRSLWWCQTGNRTEERSSIDKHKSRLDVITGDPLR